MSTSSPSKSTICSCQNLLQSAPCSSSATTFCNTCIKTLLRSKIAQHNAALKERNIKRDECAQTLTRIRFSGLGQPGQLSPLQKIESYQDQIRILSSNIDEMGEECGKKSVSLASFSVLQTNRAVEVDQKRRLVMQLRRNLELLRSSVLLGNDEMCHQTLNGDEDDHENTNENVGNTNEANGNLSSTIHSYIEQVKQRRFRLVLEAFEMHRVDVGHEHKSLTIQDLLAGEDGAIGNHHERHSQIRQHDQKNQQDTRFQKLVRQRIPSGIGKIGGLPLPHRGPSVYNKLLPTNVLTSSIRLIASLTNLLARCLSIELPHPIVLCPMPNMNVNRMKMRDEFVWLKDQTADIVESVGRTSTKDEDKGLTLMKHLDRLDNNEDTDDCDTIGEEDVLETSGHGDRKDLAHGSLHKTSLGVSTSSLRSLVGSSSNLLSRAFDKMKGHNNHHNIQESGESVTSSTPQIPMDQDSVSLRQNHATYAIVYESNSRRNGSVVKYELKPPSSSIDLEVQRQQEEHFNIGLQLLQNDIIALCIQAGVPVQMLWPAEAPLLNLNSLRLYVSGLLGQTHEV